MRQDLANRVDAAVMRSRLAESITYTPMVGAPVSIKGVFKAEFQEANLLTGSVEETGPRVGIHLSDLQAPPQHGDQVSIRGVNYKVVQIQADGPDVGAILKLEIVA